MTDIQFLLIIGTIYLSHLMSPTIRFGLGMTAIIFAAIKLYGIS